MAILTRGEFAGIAQAKAGFKGIRSIVNENRQFTRASQTTSVFLSHSHTDKDAVEQAVAFLRTLGIRVYVDWMDETMPERTNGITAQNIKGKIRENDKFILLATNAAVASKWCNWELGYGDTYKFDKNKIAILPLADNNRTWNGNEYLQIYPRIETDSSYGSIQNFSVWYPNGNRESIISWLSR